MCCVYLIWKPLRKHQKKISIITWNKTHEREAGSLSLPLRDLLNHPLIKSHLSLPPDKIVLVNFYIFWENSSPPCFERDFFFCRRTIPKTRLWFPARVERWRNIPVGWRWEASNKVPGPCGEGCELLWSSYISKLLAELLQIAAISTPAAQSSADGVSARVRPHQSETAYPPEGSRGRAGGWGIIVSASSLIGKTSAGWLDPWTGSISVSYWLKTNHALE